MRERSQDFFTELNLTDSCRKEETNMNEHISQFMFVLFVLPIYRKQESRFMWTRFLCDRCYQTIINNFTRFALLAHFRARKSKPLGKLLLKGHLVSLNYTRHSIPTTAEVWNKSCEVAAERFWLRKLNHAQSFARQL